jgi:hypothetical protein
MATPHPSPRFLTQTILEVSVASGDNSQFYVHVRKGPGSTYGQHPQLTPNEAEAVARDIANAAADARRKNVAKKL